MEGDVKRVIFRLLATVGFSFGWGWFVHITEYSWWVMVVNCWFVIVQAVLLVFLIDSINVDSPKGEKK